MRIISDRALKQLEEELAVLKRMVDQQDGGRRVMIARNTIRSMDNERRIQVLEDRTLRLSGMLTAVYLYLKSQPGFDHARFMAILEMVAEDKRMRRVRPRARPRSTAAKR